MEILINKTTEERVNVLKENRSEIISLLGCFGRHQKSDAIKFMQFMLDTVSKKDFDFEFLFSFGKKSIEISDLMEILDERLLEMEDDTINQSQIKSVKAQNFFAQQTANQMKLLY